MKPETPCLRRSEWEVRAVDIATAYELVKAYHYAKSGSNTATFVHGLFKRSDFMRCYGVAWWIPPTKGAAVATWNGDWQQVLALSRLAIDPEVPTNGASFLIGESIKLIRKDGRFKCLVTYADDWRGHTGAIYRATNWEYVGKTKAERTYVNKRGELVARKAGPKTRTQSEMLELGATVIGSFAKHKFRMILEKECLTK